MLAKGGAYSYPTSKLFILCYCSMSANFSLAATASKRYQAEERERETQWLNMAARNSRDREHLLSKQTAQRQK